MGAGDGNFVFAHGTETQQENVFRGFCSVKIVFYTIDGNLSFMQFIDQPVGIVAGADTDDDMRSGRSVNDFHPVIQAGADAVNQDTALFSFDRMILRRCRSKSPEAINSVSAI